MQSTLPVFLMTNSDANCNSPQQKLRKISFDISQHNQLPLLTKHKQCYIVEGWGNHNWDLKTESLSNNIKLKSISRVDNDKTSQRSRRPTVSKDRSTDRTNKYIERLEEKLCEIANTRQHNQTVKLQPNNEISQNPNLNYLMPKKPSANGQRTTSTSESECQKCDHNFMTTFDRKQKQKYPSFKIKKISKEIMPEVGFKSFNQFDIQEIPHKSHRQKTNRSMLTSYEPLTQRSKQISIISYPMIDHQKISRKGPKLNKLNDFFLRFNSRNNPEKIENKQSISLPKSKILTKNQDFLFKIKVTQPKQKQLKIHLNL